MGSSLQEIAILSGHSQPVWHAAWHPSGRLLATCSADKSIKLWAPSGDIIGLWECKETQETSHSKSVRRVEWSRSGELLASASFDGTVVIWKLQNNGLEPMLTLEGHESEVKGISWSFEDKYLATCGRDKTIWIWETDIDFEYETAAVLSRHTQDVKSVAFHDTLFTLASCSYDDTIGIWELDETEDWVCRDMLAGHESTVWSVVWKGNKLLSGSDDRSIRVWNLEDARFKTESVMNNVHRRSVYSCDWHRTQDLIVTGGGDHHIKLISYSTSGLTPLYSLQAHSMDINSVSFNPCYNLLASSSDDCTVKLYALI
jgi:hypothetical protein